MSEINFEKNWLSIIGIFILLAAFPVLICLSFLWKVIIFWETDVEFVKINFPNLMLALIVAVSAVFCAWLFTSVLTIKFTDEGVWQRNLLRWNFIAWEKVTYVEEISYGITLYDRQKKIRLFLAFFADLNGVLSFIRERISSKAAL